MGDKESLEPQKPALFHPPSLAASGKGVCAGQMRPSNGNGGGSSNNNNNGYYQNVTQKGKLILPTAIWILIVVGGLCFLSLLSSLNKTVNTLDELVEIEQANSKLADSINQHNHEYHAHKHRHHSAGPATPVSERLEWSGNDDEIKPTASQQHKSLAEPRVTSSWLAMPPWASLDKSDFVRRVPGSDSGLFPSKIQSMLDNLIRAADNSGSPIEGSIIVASSGADSPDAPSQMFGLGNPFESIMKQLMGGDSDESRQSAAKLNEGDDNSLPTITANIDKINININAGSDLDSDESSSNKKNSKKHSEEDENDNEDSQLLDESIDSLMNKLMNNERLSPADNLVPMRFGPMPGGHHHHHGPHPAIHRPVSELAPHAIIDGSIVPMFGRPQNTPQLVIALDGNDNQLGDLPVMPSRGPPFSPYELMPEHRQHNHHRHHHYHHQSRPPMGNQQPPVGMEEFSIGSNNNSPGSRDEALFLNSLAQSLLPMQQENKHQEPEISTSDQQEPEAVIFINGKPLISEKQQSLASDEESLLKTLTGNDDKREQTKQNQIKDLFTMVFGPAPSSELFSPPAAEPSAPPKTPEPTAVEPVVIANVSSEQPTAAEKAASGFGEQEQADKAPALSPSGKDQGEMQDLFEPLLKITEPKNAELPSMKEDSAKLPLLELAHGPADESSDKEVEHLVSSLLGFPPTADMFSLPQFPNDQAPLQVEAQSGGGRQELSSTRLGITSSPSTISLSDDIKMSDWDDSVKIPEPIPILIERFPTTTGSPVVKPLGESSGPLSSIPPQMTVPEPLGKDREDLMIEPTTQPPASLPLSSTIQPSSTLAQEVVSSTTIAPTLTPTTSSVKPTTPSDMPNRSIPTTTGQPLGTAASNVTTTQKPTIKYSGSSAVPVKTFLQKADDFIGRNIMSIRRFLS